MSDAGRGDRAVARGHAAIARSRWLSVGSRAGFRDHRAVHHRRSLRSRGGDRARRTARARGRARRSAVPGRVPCADGRGARLVRLRERRECDRRQADGAASARVRGRPDRRRRRADPAHWEEHKAKERAALVAASGKPPSELADVPLALPALARAAKLGKRAGRVGFDWPDAAGVREKIDEELRETDEAPDAGQARGGDRRPAVRGRELVAASRNRSGGSACASRTRSSTGVSAPWKRSPRPAASLCRALGAPAGTRCGTRSRRPQVPPESRVLAPAGVQYGFIDPRL